MGSSGGKGVFRATNRMGPRGGRVYTTLGREGVAINRDEPEVAKKKGGVFRTITTWNRFHKGWRSAEMGA